MKLTRFVFLTILSTIISYSNFYGQLSVYAGPDTILCESNFQDYQMGDHVIIKGNFESITYSWSCEYPTSIGSFYASSFLSDTSISHPLFISGFDTLSFKLEVTDDKGIKASDTVEIILSQYIICLGEWINWINEGDSIKLGHCIQGGIPPFYYLWDHAESLSNPTIANPWAKPDTTTEYLLTLTDNAGCIKTSRCKVVVFPVSVEKTFSINSQIKVFPNPTNSYGHIKIENPSILKFTIKFYDVQGRLQLEKNIDKQVSLIESNSLNSGIYLFNIVLEEKVIQTGKIIIN